MNFIFFNEYIKFFDLFSADCTSVTCSFTIDNIAESAKYNGDSLTITTNDLNDWKEEKTVTFESCYDGSPGKLTIKGSDLTDGKLNIVFSPLQPSKFTLVLPEVIYRMTAKEY